MTDLTARLPQIADRLRREYLGNSESASRFSSFPKYSNPTAATGTTMGVRT